MTAPRRTHAAILAAIAALPAASAAGQQLHFGSPEYVDCTPAHYPTRVRLFDMDGDGRLDVVVPGRDADGLLNWAPVNPDGTFGAIQAITVDGQTDDAIAVDLDGDGQQELVLAIRSYAGRLQVLRRAANGSMQPQPPIRIDREPRSLAAGDFDGDGDMDLAVSCYGSEHVLVLSNDGAGNLSPRQRIRVDPWSGGIPGPQDIAAADLDLDGRADLIVGCLGTRRFDVFRGLPGGSFALPVSWVTPEFPAIPKPAIGGFSLADVDGDGDLDIAVALLATASEQPLAVMRNDGTGRFTSSVMVGSVTVGYHWGAIAADFDGDGRVDVVTGTALPGGIYAWRNLTAGGTVAFGVPVKLEYSVFPRDYLVANMDGDCDLDLVEADIGGHYVLSYPNLRNCGGSFAGDGAPVPPVAAVPGEPGDSPACDVARRLGAYGPEPSLVPPAHGFTVPPPSCGPTGPGGRCDEVHPTPGCFTTSCCEKVCGFAPDCCTVSWEQVCVDIADDECSGLVCPSYGPCTVVHDDPGCEDPTCCERITPLDGYCGGATWDWVCVDRAQELCGLPPCTVTVPAGTVSEGEACYQRFNEGASREGTAGVIVPGNPIAGTCTHYGSRDTDWYRLERPGATRIRVIVDAEFPAEVHLMRGPMNGPLELRATWTGGRCTPIVEEADVDAGSWYVVVTLGMDAGPVRSGQPCTDPDPDNPPPPDDPPIVPGFDGIDYLVRIECIQCATQADLNGDGFVNGADLGLLLGAWGIPHPPRGDLNYDGVVNGADLGLLLGAWSTAGGSGES